METPCPSCGHPFPAGAPACPACGVRLVGADAQRLWEVDQQLAALGRERATLLAALRTPLVGTAAPTTTIAAPPAGRTGSTPRPARSWTVQQLLLTGGVVLLLVAAVVFIAVAWDRIGTGGQVAVLAVVTASGVAGSRALSRRGLHASAEAVAVLTCGLALLDAFAVRRYGLFASDRLDEPTYWLVGLPLVALVLLAGTRAVRRSLVFPVATVLVLAVWPGALAASLEVGVTGVSLIAAGAWAVALGAALLLAPTARRPVLVAVAAVAAAWLLLGAQATLVDVASNPPWDGGLLALLSAAVLITGLVVAARRSTRSRGVDVAARAAAYALAVGVVASEAHHGGAWGLTVVSVLASAVVAVAVVAREDLRLPGGAMPAVVALSWLSGLVSLGESDASWSATGVWLAATCLASAAASRTVHGAARTQLTAYSAATGALALGSFAHGGGDVVRVAVTALLVAAFAGAAAWRRDHREEAGLAVGGVVAAVVGAGYALSADDRPLVLLAVVLGVSGVASLAYGILPRRGLVAVAGVALCSAATWSLALDARVDAVEAYSLPLAALALGAGITRHVRRPGAPSWTTVGPGLSAGLLPSAVASVPDTGLTRPLLTLLGAVVVTAVGVWLREQAPVVTGVVASVIVAVAQLGPYAVAMPRWVSLGLAGALLLAMGFRYEQRRREAVAAAHWLGALR